MNPRTDGRRNALALSRKEFVPANQREPIEHDGIDRLSYWQGMREGEETARRLRESRARSYFLGGNYPLTVGSFGFTLHARSVTGERSRS